jgi:hypothetical protein
MRTIVYLVTAVGALAALTTTAGAGGSRPNCQANRTFAQASRNGSLPAVYAALHGGAVPNASFLNCSPKR